MKSMNSVSEVVDSWIAEEELPVAANRKVVRVRDDV